MRPSSGESILGAMIFEVSDDPSGGGETRFAARPAPASHVSQFLEMLSVKEVRV